MSINLPTPQDAAGAPKVGGARMVVAMGLIGLLSGVLIVFTFQATLSTINANKARALEKAVFEVLPGATTTRVFRLTSDNRLIPDTGKKSVGEKLFAGYDADNQLVGLAIEATGPGFQDTLKVLYGYSPKCGCIVGFKVLESKETPGLGDKIETDDRFRANFRALKVLLIADKSRVKQPIVMAKKGKKTKPWQVEAITGATVSSKAVTKILAASTLKIVPVIERHLTLLKSVKKP